MSARREKQEMSEGRSEMSSPIAARVAIDPSDDLTTPSVSPRRL
jgi:hypothetical protein